MNHFYLHYSPSHKWFDEWDIECLLCLIESWALGSSLINFKLAWKTDTHSTLVMAKYCSDLTLLNIDNQHLFLQHHTAILIQHLVVLWSNRIIFHLRVVLKSL